MRRFFKYIGLLVVVVLALMLVLDAAYSYTFKHSEPRSKIQKILQLEGAYYDYVFLGSSRTENHIDCAIIEQLTGKSCINMGISGGSIGDMVVLMQLMQARNVTFDQVLLQLDYNYNSTGLSPNFKARLMPFIKEPAVSEALTTVGLSKAERYIPFYRYMKNDQVIGFREFVSSVLNRKPQTDIDIGFLPKTGIGDGIATSFPMEIAASNEEVTALLDFMDSIEKSIQFFTAPYCPKVQRRDAAMKQLESRVANLWNYVAVYDTQAEYYFNCGHLNKEGAQDFSKKLANRLIQNTD